MKSSNIFWVGIGIVAMVLACEHEPFPAPPGQMNDTITDPVDTTGNPIDTTAQGKPCHPDTVYFNRDIMPILSTNCAYSGCHNAGTAKGKVVLDNYQNVFKTADIEPGDPDGGKLYELITENDPKDRMPKPPNKPLQQADIDLIKKWILQGAKDLKCDECDTTAISFNQHIKPIFTKSCAYNCHSGTSPTGGLLLTNYGNIADAVINGEVLPRINHKTGFPKMPPSEIKLSDCKLKQIDLWVKAGAPNN